MSAIAGVAFGLLFTGVSIALADAETWTKYPQPDGGWIWLPQYFRVIALASSASSKSIANGETVYTQDLLSAKGAISGVVNSINASRTWVEAADGRIRRQPSTNPEQFIRAILSQVNQRGLEYRVIDGPCQFTLGMHSGWRVSVSFNEGGSRMDQFAIQKGCVLHALNAVYSTSGAMYWIPTTNEVVSKWEPAAAMSDKAAATRPAATAAWKFVELSSGERFCLPSSWVVVSQDDPPSKQTTDGQSIVATKILNVRANRRAGDISLVHVMSFSVVDDASGRAVAINDTDLLEFHESTVDGLAPAMQPSGLALPIRRLIAGSITLATPLVGSASIGTAGEGLVLSTVRGGRAYCFLVSFAKGSLQACETMLEEVISRSKFCESADVARFGAARDAENRRKQQSKGRQLPMSDESARNAAMAIAVLKAMAITIVIYSALRVIKRIWGRK